jgi:hypothetical protein
MDYPEFRRFMATCKYTNRMIVGEFRERYPEWELIVVPDYPAAMSNDADSGELNDDALDWLSEHHPDWIGWPSGREPALLPLPLAVAVHFRLRWG